MKKHFTTLLDQVTPANDENYWLEQEKKNVGRMNIAHYMKVCSAKAYNLRWNESTKTWSHENSY